MITETCAFCGQIGYEPQIKPREVRALIKEYGLERLLVPQEQGQ